MKRLLLIICCVLLLTACGSASHTPAGRPGHSETEASCPSISLPDEETSLPSVSPDKPEKDSLLDILNTMSLEEKVGQLFLARCPEKHAADDIKQYHLGGYILFSRDFKDESVSTLKAKLAEYQDAAEIPLLMAVDEEGGQVVRISKYPAFRSEPFPSARELYDHGGIAAIEQNEQERASFLHSLGLNVNLAPVCDITTNPQAFMYRRSLGQSPETTGKFVEAVVPIMRQNGVGAVLKHFPGYGNNTDTHTAIATDSRSIAQLESSDLVPFQHGIRSGCGAIMVSHVYINAIDSGMPATLSPAVHRYLRENMGFDGVIVTDDLVMQAIAEQFGPGESAVLAVAAGNDLLCSTEYQVQYDAVLSAVKSGRITEERIDESVLRILEWKKNIGLI